MYFYISSSFLLELNPFISRFFFSCCSFHFSPKMDNYHRHRYGFCLGVAMRLNLALPTKMVVYCLYFMGTTI